jgi:predicted kinase
LIVIIAGLPGTGKSTVSRAVAERTGAIVLDKDAIRAVMFPGNTVEYTTEQDDVVIEAMLNAAGYMLRSDGSRVIILDGRPFARNAQLQLVTRFADSIPTKWQLVECVCGEATARGRLMRDKEHHPAANRDWQLYLAIKDQYEPKPQPKIVIDTEDELSASVEALIRQL